MRYLLLISMLGLTACGAGGGSGSGGGSAAIAPRLFVYGDNAAAGQGSAVKFAQVIATYFHMALINRAAPIAPNDSMYYAFYVNNAQNTPTNISDIGPQDIVLVYVGYDEVRSVGQPPLGMNNFWGGYEKPFFNGLAAIGCKVKVVGPHKIAPAIQNAFVPNNHGTDAGIADMNAFLQTQSIIDGSANFKYIDISAGFNPIAANLQADLQYPNETGHALIANLILAGW